METIPCPGCRTELEPSATVCHICTRPRNRLEITRAYATMREMKRQRERRPYIIAGYLLAAGAAGWLLYRFHAPLVALTASVWTRGGKAVDEALSSAVPTPVAVPPPPDAPAPASPPASASAFPAAPVKTAPSAAPSAAPATATPASDKPARPLHVVDLPRPPMDPTIQWAFYGRVFDVITLKPVPNAQLSFNATTGGMGAYTMSDAEGRFMVVLRRLQQGSYEIRVSNDGYAAPVLYESDIPYATLPIGERRDIVLSAQDGDISLPPLTDVAGEASVRRDVFLAPSR